MCVRTNSFTFNRLCRKLFGLITISLFSAGCSGDIILSLEKEQLFPVFDPAVITIGSIRKTGQNVANRLSFDGTIQRAQGMAISDSVMYRFFTTGLCQTFDITDVDNPVEIATFKLGSYGSSNHSNSAQFYVDNNGEKLLYLSGMGGKCYVERINENSSKLIQTITLEKISYLQNSVRVNTICGDDGYLWLFGIDTKGDMLVFARAKRPDPRLSEAIITKEDILDFWHKKDYKFSESLSQGGKVYGGNLFFVFGSQTTDSHLDIYNVFTHQIVYSVDLNDIISEEPEDCDIFGNCLILTVDGGKGYYVLDMIDHSK